MILKYYHQQILSDFKKLLKEFSWNGTASKRSAKTGFACIIAVLLADKLDLGMSYWAAMTTIFTMQAHTTASFKLGFYRTVGTICGAIVGIIVLGLVIQNCTLINISLFVLLTISFYLRYRSDHGLFWVFFGVTLFMVILVGNDSDPAYTIQFAFNRSIEIIIGAVTAILVDIYIWPQHTTEIYFQHLKEFKLNYNNSVKEVFSLYFKKEQGEFNKCKIALEKAYKNFNSLNLLIRDARLESRISKLNNIFIDIDTVALSNELQDLNDFINRTPKRPDYKFHYHYEKNIDKILNLLDIYLQLDSQGKIRKSKSLIRKIKLLLSDLELSFVENKKSKFHRKYNIIEIISFYEFINLLKNYIVFLSVLSDYKYSIKKPLKALPEAIKNPLYKSDFYSLNLFSKTYYLDKPTLKYSIQGSIIILIVIWLWKILEIPGGNLSIAVAVFVVVLPEASSSYSKGLMRFLGCALGAVMGFAFLALQIESTFLMCILVFLGMYLCAYLYTGGPNISYLGRQAGYAFVIAALPQFHPATDIEIILNRFIGIFFGVGCAWAFRWFFWNDDVENNFKTQNRNIRKVFLSSYVVYKNLCKNPNSKILFTVTDISSAKVALKILDHNNEFSVDKCKLLMEWLDHIEQLFFRYDSLLNINREYFLKTIALKPEIITILFQISKKLSSNFFKSNINSISKDFRKLKIIIREYPNQLREIWVENDINFTEKQCYMHIFVLTNRIARRLNYIFELQKQLENIY